MKKDGVWVDHVVVKSTARMLGKDIVVINNSERDFVMRIDGINRYVPERDPIYLGHVLDLHYESIEHINGDHGTTGYPGKCFFVYAVPILCYHSLIVVNVLYVFLYVFRCG